MARSPMDTLRKAAAHYEARRFAEAAALCDEIIASRTVVPDAFHLGGLVAFERGDHARGVTLLQKAIDAGIRNPGAFANLAICLVHTGQISRAHKHMSAALAMAPMSAHVQAAAADVFLAMGSVGESVTHLRNALQWEPSPEVHSNLLYALNFMSGKQSDLCEEHRAFGAAYDDPNGHLVEHANDPNPQRKLRVGYLSADMKSHSVAHFLAPLLAAHDREQVWVHAFPSVTRPDAVTDRLKEMSDAWTSVAGLSNKEAADKIREASIDVLVELGGHTGNSRLLSLAHRPAPVQVSFLGYPNTTGIAASRYRITDALVDSEDTPLSDYVETLVRLPGGFLCYEGPENSPEVAASPVSRTGAITFGSFNTLAKMTPRVVELWARIVGKVQGARLFLKAGPLADEGVRKHVQQQFEAHGLDPSRLLLEGRTPGQLGHLERYADVDIALDPFPYNGTTTTCEALFMGVPVIALAGDRHVSRVSASILQRVGLDAFVGTSPKHYQQIAVDLSQQRKRLGELREGMRARFLASPLCDRTRYAREVEAAYRQMWTTWCARKNAP